jgi:5-methyltetrahydropteroyltriglutamate--homocysteine methyltransferase
VIATNNGPFPWRGGPAGRALEEALKDGGPAPEEVRLLQDRVTREAIDSQIAAGLDLVTDGMVRAPDPTALPAALVGGLAAGPRREGYPAGGPYTVPIVTDEVAWRRPILTEDYLFASRGCPRPVKPVLTGPYTLARLAEDRAYGDPMALATALAAALNQELRSLQAAGATLIQIDEPACLLEPAEFPIFSRVWEVLGRGITTPLALHLEGGDAGPLFAGIARLKRLACLSLDTVRGRAGLASFAAVRWPDGLRLGLGVVDGRDARVESADEIAAVVRSIPGLPPPDRILLGTAASLGDLPPDTAAAKLRGLAEAARRLRTAG